jgi:hypothetical protein
MPISKWRIGKKVSINVYDGDDRPICQCHDEDEAKFIVEAVNHYLDQIDLEK